MKYIVWKVTDQNFEEEAILKDYVLAQMYAEMFACGLKDGERYEVTKIGETPVW